jgi:hypothetical protein
LRKRVEVSGMHAARHDVVARALRRRLDETGRLDLEKFARVEKIPHRFYDAMADPQITLETRATQIEIAILQAQRLVDVALDVNRERWREGTRENLRTLDREFDRTRGELRIFGTRRTRAHRSAHGDHVFVAERLRELEHVGAFRIEDRLRDAVAVAYVDEHEAAVIASAVHPAADLDARSHGFRIDRPARR